MNRIFIVLGGSGSGKSSVIRSLKYNNNEKHIFMKLSSFQELVEFCDYEEVIRKLKEYIKKCEEKANKCHMSSFVIVIAFALRRNKKRELGVKCITNPLEFLRFLPKYKIHVIHLRRNVRRLQEVGAFIENNLEIELTLQSEETTKGRQDGNGRRLRDFILRVADNH